jgi:outer membrane biogenesis lipoprotein LolB
VAKRGGVLKRRGTALLIVSAAALVSCHTSRPAVAPPPPTVESIEGFATFRLAREGESAKSKLSFLFRLPGQGRIEVLDPLGRTASILFLDNDMAYLVLPGRRAYWKSGRQEIMSKLLGFSLGTEDLLLILTGRADRLSGWSLEKDGRGRVVRGRCEDLGFEVRQFFEPGPLPWLLVLSRAEDKGSLRVLKMSFNQPIKENAFRHFFLDEGGYRPADWSEVERWLRETGGR